MNLTFIYVFIALLVIIIIIGNLTTKSEFIQIEEQMYSKANEPKQNNENAINKFNYEQKLYLSSPTKCFDCERQMTNPRTFTNEFAWMGKPSKCFDCEKELIQQYGDVNAGNLGHGTKCFSCEKEMEKYINTDRNSITNCYGYYDIN